MGDMRKKLKKIIDKVLLYLLMGVVITLFIGIVAFFWWLDHVRFVF